MSNAEDNQAPRKGGAGASRFYIILGAIAVVGAVFVGREIFGGGEAVTSPVELAIEGDSALLAIAEQGVLRGDRDHPITVMEFVDYQCSACQQFALMMKPQIDVRLVDSGRARFMLYDFPIVSLHQHAFLAARAARCAGDQDRYWEYHDILFRNQSIWFFQESVVGSFSDYAREIGLNGDDFDSCLRSDRHAEVVTANMHFGDGLRVSATPTVMVNSPVGFRRLATSNFEALDELITEIEAQLEQGG